MMRLHRVDITISKFLNPKSHVEALKIIARFGTDELTVDLEAFAENEMVDSRVRSMAAKVAEHLRNK